MERKYCSACSERYCPIEEIKLNAQINIFASLLKSSDEKSSDENSPPPPKKSTYKNITIISFLPKRISKNKIIMI